MRLFPVIAGRISSGKIRQNLIISGNICWRECNTITSLKHITSPVVKKARKPNRSFRFGCMSKPVQSKHPIDSSDLISFSFTERFIDTENSYNFKFKIVHAEVSRNGNPAKSTTDHFTRVMTTRHWAHKLQ